MIDSIMARLREPQFIREMHEMILHGLAQSGDELESVFRRAVA